MVEKAEFLFDLAPFQMAASESFDLAAERRHMVLWRLDGGFGTDPNLRWLVKRNYHFHAKGFAGRRAANLAKKVQRWIPYGDVWLGSVASPVDYGCPVRVWVKRRRENGQYKHSYYVSTLKLHSMTQAMRLYDQRGQAEVEQFRNDKQGLHLSRRRKHLLVAQQALILLTDLAHNLLADFHNLALVDTVFEGFAAKRIVRDLFAIEGNLVWRDEKLVRIELSQEHPHAEKILGCLKKYCDQA